jgi:2'-5' RNA ligase
MKANWFLGVPVPGDRAIELAGSPPEGVRLFHAADLHVTIAFLGACGEERARAAWSALAWPLGPIDASLGAVVPMGSPRQVSALSALVEDGRGEVERAIGAVRDVICAAAAVPPDPRPPKAHVTIARLGRRTTPRQRRAAVAWARGLALAGLRVRLESVALYTWDETRLVQLFRAVEVRAAGP